MLTMKIKHQLYNPLIYDMRILSFPGLSYMLPLELDLDLDLDLLSQIFLLCRRDLPLLLDRLLRPRRECRPLSRLLLRDLRLLVREELFERDLLRDLEDFFRLLDLDRLRFDFFGLLDRLCFDFFGLLDFDLLRLGDLDLDLDSDFF